MTPRLVRIAVLLASLSHGFFILTGRYRLSYDAFTHMLFANHYAEHWFSLWEPRWYTGFTVVSYPPLVHQLIAGFIPILGFEKAFALILWLVTAMYPLGVYVFARIFTGKTPASYAALASAWLLPIYVTAHVFGQLPFLASTLLALFSAASLNRYLREGGALNFCLTVSLYATTMAAHHATLLVHPFFVVAVIVRHVSQVSNLTLALRFFSRLVSLGVCIVLSSLLVIFPFWQWGLGQAMQTPIDHLSRHNFFADPLALAIFFLPMYGPLCFSIPFLVRKWHRDFAGLLFAFVVLFILGLGGTTSLPKIFFGNSWEWLTYDRFAFWAALTLMPFFGIFFIRLKQRFRPKLQSAPARKNLIFALTFSLFAITSLGSWFAPYFIQLQPNPVDLRPIVKFLDAEDRSQYRYLTFGFGDQFAHLNLLTQATTIDGSYHTARTLPELRASGIGQVDTSYWALNGMQAIVPILENSGEHGVRWGFVNPKTVQALPLGKTVIYRSPFVPILEALGWEKLPALSNGVLVYENPNAKLPPSVEPPTAPPVTSFAWGIFPLASLIVTLALAGVRIVPIQAARFLRLAYTFTVGLVPLALCFWYYLPVFEFPHPRIYFTYTDALFFASDILVCCTLIFWFSAPRSLTVPRPRAKKIFDPRAVLYVLFFICLLSTVSLLWSSDWRISAYLSLHQILLLLFSYALYRSHHTWMVIMFGLCAALAIEVIVGFSGFALQSTTYLAPFQLNWPGDLAPELRGASVVQLQNGLRVLRAYGTLPHPNILGGVVLLALIGPASLYLEKYNRPALFLFSLGLILLVLTFSRSAWLGLIASLFILILKSGHLHRPRLYLLIAACLVTLGLALYPLRDLFFVRLNNAPVATEQLSTFGRTWLTQQAVAMFQAQPLTGVGIGSFIVELSQHAIAGALIEPVHNVFLLVGAELGAGGMLLLLALVLVIAVNLYQTTSPRAILIGATLTGLGVVSLFDHYLWSLAPGRTLFAFALGIWLGALEHDA